jgi:HD-GYP domain-containing protein (c-di-GMP phosphodiesterase class II)
MAGTRPETGPVTPRLPEPLLVLDHFVQELQRCDQAGKQLHLLLQSVAESIQADVVFVQSVLEAGIFEMTGKYPVSADWCRDLLRELLQDRKDGDAHLVDPGHDPCPGKAMPAPVSVALVQISKSKATWAVAVSFTPGHKFQLVDVQLMGLARRLLVSQSRQLRVAEKLKETLLGLIHCLTAAIDAKDPYTCGHSERVARMGVRIAQEMGFPEPFISDLYLGGLLHDIGKIGVRDVVLQKPGPLTEEEMKEVQAHPVIGDRIISNVHQLAHLRPGVRNHHERYDGLGYPDRLAGEQIPLMARILAVADSCDAMLSARPYRPPLPARQVEATMLGGAGSQWDPSIVEHFMRCRKDLYGICQRGIGHSVYMAVDRAVRAENELSLRRNVTVVRGDSPAAAVLG